MSDMRTNSVSPAFDYLAAFEPTLLPCQSMNALASPHQLVDQVPWPPDRIEMTYTIQREGSRHWFRDVATRVSELVEMPHDWNGYGEKRPHPSAAKRVVNLLDSIEYDGPAPEIVPLPDGGMQIEFHSKHGDIEIEVPPSGPAHVWVSLDSEVDDWRASGRYPGGVARLRSVLRGYLGG